MDIRIGIKDTAREIAFDTDQSREEVERTVIDSLEQSVLTLDDSKGRRYIVPSSQIAYIEIGTESTRKIGFVA